MVTQTKLQVKLFPTGNDQEAKGQKGVCQRESGMNARVCGTQGVPVLREMSVAGPAGCKVKRHKELQVGTG